MKSILNIAAGKRYPLDLTHEDLCVQLDPMYIEGSSSTLQDVEDAHSAFLTGNDDAVGAHFIGMMAQEFMETYKFVFDQIVCYRFLEHVPFTDVLYFIYLLSTTTAKEGEVEIIVPDYAKLAQMLLDENIGGPGWENENIIITTELVNDPGCPHTSVWTEDRLIHFFTLEKRFEVLEIIKDYNFDGRDIYLKAKFKNIVTT